MKLDVPRFDGCVFGIVVWHGGWLRQARSDQNDSNKLKEEAKENKLSISKLFCVYFIHCIPLYSVCLKYHILIMISILL